MKGPPLKESSIYVSEFAQPSFNSRDLFFSEFELASTGRRFTGYQIAQHVHHKFGDAAVTGSLNDLLELFVQGSRYLYGHPVSHIDTPFVFFPEPILADKCAHVKPSVGNILKSCFPP